MFGEKQTINLTYFVSVRCGRLAEGKGHETGSEFARFILFPPIKKRSFNLLCVLDPNPMEGQNLGLHASRTSRISALVISTS